MPQAVTVLGAGIVGISAALYLQKQGCVVTVVDRLPPGEATSFGNACVITDSSTIPISTPGIAKTGIKMLLSGRGPLFIRTNYLAKIAPWLVRLVRHSNIKQVERATAAISALLSGSLREHQQLAKGTPAQQWLSTEPTIFVYDNEQDFQAEAQSWDLRRRNGTEFKMVTAEQLQELEPTLNPGFKFGVVMTGHGKALNPSKLVKAHAAYFQQQGGTILQREIKALEVVDKQVRLLTDEGTLQPETLLIAAGPWSAQLSKQLGSTVPLESEGGYHVTLQEPGIEPAHPVMSSKAKVAITYMEQGLRIGGLAEFAGLDAAADFNRCEILLKNIKQIFPGVNIAQYTEWRGQRPTIVDSIPVISQSPHFANVYYAFGHQHVGLSSGPKTGKLISQLMTGQKTDIDLTPFRVERF